MKLEQLRKPRLNNMTLSYERRSVTYEAVMTDLCLMGVITQEQCEQFTGMKFNELIKPPEEVTA